ncbi:hypothetical protein C1H46_039221, partial [Malus baccata]
FFICHITGLVHRSSHAKLPFRFRQCNGAKIDNCNDVLVTSRTIVRGGRGIQYLTARRVGTICAASVRIDDDPPHEPYFLSLVKEALKTARLTLVLVVLLIVPLSSTDSASQLSVGFDSQANPLITRSAINYQN